MAWLIDGSNVLGALRADRVAVEPKRELARRLAGFARARRTRLTCFFDGPEPSGFARHLGSVTIVFSGQRIADDLIAEQSAVARDAMVVTSDRGLAARVGSRRVRITDVSDFLRMLDETPVEAEPARADDWLEWFSDPDNREKF